MAEARCELAEVGERLKLRHRGGRGVEAERGRWLAEGESDCGGEVERVEIAATEEGDGVVAEGAAGLS